MRLKIKLSGKAIFPRNNQHILNGYIHKCLGSNNKYHDTKNDYCISSIIGKLSEDKNSFELDYNSYFIISSLNQEFIDDISKGILRNKIIMKNLFIDKIEIINEDFNDGWNNFQTLTPFLIKIYKDKKNYTFLKLDNPDFNNLVHEYLVKKISKIDDTLDLSDFRVNINKNERNKSRKVIIKKVKNIANHCRISIHSNKKVAELLYNIGIGQSTGSGFGTIYKCENYSNYKLEEVKKEEIKLNSTSKRIVF